MRGSDCRNTGAWETDLGSGSKFIYQIGISCPLALCQDLNQVILIVVI